MPGAWGGEEAKGRLERRSWSGGSLIEGFLSALSTHIPRSAWRDRYCNLRRHACVYALPPRVLVVALRGCLYYDK